ncbi:uncharacterized protein LAESUDRAFT_813516 [Laetiporus sulphureus 93-53]|uniref:phosphoglycerate mutase (2,3-diphosphoglycerate-independent) n=1 Tax=Laetiporus sulphureus 93-53 TaxID=1314785 RepID=A0A165DQG7_9APHY|nr:uncharacterized protein LAESUDRAFT_813516 [Laetiporus sulphureus 93-53]KZT05402.1 hypothetical protein LAESUDRAFT_813516 [Laetiporus sulphureus 93-53]
MDGTDDFLKPVTVNGDEGLIKDGDTLFFFNYFSDRMRGIVTRIRTMPQYNAEFPFPVAFPPQPMTTVIRPAKQGMKQAYTAETGTHAHVTSFFNGGVEK